MKSEIPYPEYKDSGIEWLGRVPTHWRVEPLKRFLQRIEQGWSPECENRLRDAGEWGVLKVGCVNTGIFNSDEHKALPSTLEPRRELEIKPGDILVSRANTRDLVGAAGIVDKYEAGLLLCDKLFRLRIKSTLHDRFLLFFLRSRAARTWIEINASGASASMLNIGQETLREMSIALPPFSEQRTISAFLDRETAQIDTIIAKHRHLIHLLMEKRLTIISNIATIGLTSAVLLRDSGVEWLGQIPEHWKICTLGQITLERCDGPFGSGLKSEHYTETGVRVIRLQNIRRSGFDGTDEAFIDEDYYKRELQRHNVRGGDILIAGLGDERNIVGRACVAPNEIAPAMVKADCFRFRLDNRFVSPMFVAAQLSAGAAYDAGNLATGVTRSRIPLSVMASRKIAFPPLAEQNAIMAFLDCETSKIDLLIEKAKQSIELMKERRVALIAAAVTGKIDVRQMR